MPEFETFRNPPIAEAIIDIQVSVPPAISLEQLASYQESIKGRFPNRQEKVNFKHDIRFDQKGKPLPMAPPARSSDGYLFFSENQKIVQARYSGFTFNKLRPYESWSAFSSEGKELWEMYVTLTNPANISRISLRYLNRIELQMPVANLTDYCLLFPAIPNSLPQVFSEFFMRYSLRDDRSSAIGNITVTFDEIQAPIIPVILDIEVSQLFEVMPPKTEDLWSKLHLLREFKNRIFFNSVTEKAKALFR